MAVAQLHRLVGQEEGQCLEELEEVPIQTQLEDLLRVVEVEAVKVPDLPEMEQQEQMDRLLSITKSMYSGN